MTRTIATEFPDFPASDLPAIPEGFTDVSWHNDCMPSFVNEARRLILQIDYADPAKREYQDGHRFYLSRCNEHGEYCEEASFFASDDWNEVLSFIQSR